MKSAGFALLGVESCAHDHKRVARRVMVTTLSLDPPPPLPRPSTFSTPEFMSLQDTDCSPEVTLAFYKRLYPFKSIFTWLNHQHAPTKLFTHREFAFTLQGDVYLRYNSFNNADDLKREVCRLNPTRFEVGPVYSARVSCPLSTFCVLNCACLLVPMFVYSYM